MTNPYRAMCAELVEALENARRIIQGSDGTLHINTAEFVLRRARALLAQPEPPSLKERALTLLKAMQSRSNLLHTVHPNIPNGWVANQVEFNLLYRALLALPEPQPVAEGPMPAAELEANEL